MTTQFIWPHSNLPDPELCFGRDQELAKIRQFFEHDTVRVVHLIGLPGIGKSTMAAQIAHDLHSRFNSRVYWIELNETRDSPMASKPHHFLIMRMLQVLNPQFDPEIYTDIALPANMRNHIRVLLQNSCNVDDVKDICFDLNIDYERLDGSPRSKVITLIQMHEQRDHISDLLRACHKVRPDLGWPSLTTEAFADTSRLVSNEYNRLISHLQAEEVMFVLNNVHVVIDAVRILKILLQDSSGLRLLITSHSSFSEEARLAQVKQIRLNLLPVDNLSLRSDSALLLASPVVNLFEYFARRRSNLDPLFKVTYENVYKVAEICLAREGWPPALAVAAQALGSGRQTLDQLLDETRRRRPRTASNWSDMPYRLREAIELTYRTLSPWAQIVFYRLAVFKGKFSWEGVDQICDNLMAPPAFDLTEGFDELLEARLLEKSSIQNRWNYFAFTLEPFRSYAHQRLDGRPEEDEMLQGRHAEYYVELAEQAAPQLFGDDSKIWLERLDTERDNFHAALVWTQVNRRVDLELRLTGALAGFWYYTGAYADGRHYLADALKHAQSWPPESPTPDTERILKRNTAKVALAAGNFFAAYGDRITAREYFEQSLNLYTELGDGEGKTKASYSLGTVALEDGAQNRERFEEARGLFEQSLESYRRLGDKVSEAQTLSALGQVAFYQGEYTQARKYQQASLDKHAEIGNELGEGLALANLADVDLAEGFYTEARQKYLKVLKLGEEAGDDEAVAEGLRGLAMTDSARHDTTVEEYEWAARLFGAHDAHRFSNELPMQPPYWPIYETALEAARERLGSGPFQVLYNQGSETSLEAILARLLPKANPPSS